MVPVLLSQVNRFARSEKGGTTLPVSHPPASRHGVTQGRSTKTFSTFRLALHLLVASQ
jgi:hypothetical protein